MTKIWDWFYKINKNFYITDAKSGNRKLFIISDSVRRGLKDREAR
jgi:hypothetical protein